MRGNAKTLKEKILGSSNAKLRGFTEVPYISIEDQKTQAIESIQTWAPQMQKLEQILPKPKDHRVSRRYQFQDVLRKAEYKEAKECRDSFDEYKDELKDSYFRKEAELKGEGKDSEEIEKELQEYSLEIVNSLLKIKSDLATENNVVGEAAHSKINDAIKTFLFAPSHYDFLTKRKPKGIAPSYSGQTYADLNQYFQNQVKEEIENGSLKSEKLKNKLLELKPAGHYEIISEHSTLVEHELLDDVLHKEEINVKDFEQRKMDLLKERADNFAQTICQRACELEQACNNENITPKEAASALGNANPLMPYGRLRRQNLPMTSQAKELTANQIPTEKVKQALFDYLGAKEFGDTTQNNLFSEYSKDLGIDTDKLARLFHRALQTEKK